LFEKNQKYQLNKVSWADELSSRYFRSGSAQLRKIFYRSSSAQRKFCKFATLL